MAIGCQLTSIFLLCLLSEADYSSAFPRVSSSGYTETRQGVSEKPQEGYGYGNRRPLHYIQAFRQSYREMQAKVQDQARVMTQQKPQRNAIRVHSQAQIQSRPSLFSQTQSQYRARTDVATKWPQERTPPQMYVQPIQYRLKHAPQAAHQHYSQLGPAPTHTNYPQAKPRSFEFSIKVPFANFPAQNKVIGGGTKGSDPVSGGSDGSVSDSQSTYRPTSVKIHSSFNRPRFAGGSMKGSTNDPNGANNTHDVSKPSFQISLSVPISSSTPSTKPSSSNVGFVENLHEPNSAGFVQNSYMEPEQRETGPAQSGFFFNSGSNVQREGEQRMNGPVQIKPTDGEQANQHRIPIEQPTQAKFPNEQNSHGFPKPGMAKYPPPSMLPSLYPPPQYENVPSGYYSSQIKPFPGPINAIDPVYPTFAPSQYGRGQTEQTTFPVGAPPTFAPMQYNYGQFKPSSGIGQNPQTIPHPIHPVPPSFPTVAPSQYEQPSFGNHHLPHFPDVPSKFHQTQTQLPTRYTGKGQLDGKPKFTKLVIDTEHESPSQGAVAQHGYFAAPITHYDGYSAGFSEPPSPGLYGQGQHVLKLVPASHPESADFGYEQEGIEHNRPVASSFETYPSNRPESYTLRYGPTPSVDSDYGQYVYHPQKQMEQIRYSDHMPEQTDYAPYLGASDGSVPTYFGQVHIEEGGTLEPTSEPEPDSFGTSQHGQYPGSCLQPQQHTWNGGRYSYGGGYTPSSVRNGYMPSSSPREPMPQSAHMSVSGGYGDVDSGGYKPSSSPRRPMAQGLYDTGYKPNF